MSVGLYPAAVTNTDESHTNKLSTSHRWWDGDTTVRTFSLPDTPRTRNLEANPKVSLNFAGDGKGGDIVVLQGEASIDRDALLRLSAGHRRERVAGR